jgi:DHA1 family tetracycline resistance protein-like MFS transporter
LSVFQFNFTIFLKDIYQWGPVIIGSMLTIVGVCEITSRALLLPWLLKHFNEKNIGIAGLIGLGLGLGLILSSIYIHSVVVISLAVIFIITGEGLFDPTYTGRLSQSVDESKQGKLQGVNQSLQSANNMLIPLGAAAIYFYSPSMLYATATFVVLAAVIMYVKYLPQE